MKPSQPDIEYCIQHAGFVNGLLEKRGGWDYGDWCVRDTKHAAVRVRLVTATSGLGPSYAYTDCSIVGHGRGERLIWLPSVDDVLAMLEERKARMIMSRRIVDRADGSIYYRAETDIEGLGACEGATRLIALLELLRAVDNV